MNKVFLMGRLTADPELRTTPQGTNVTAFTIAVNRKFSKDGEKQADFLRCTAWRGQAEFICKYFKKGSMILVIGNIQTRSWEDRDGKKQSAGDIIIDEAYFTGEKKENMGENTEPSFDDFTPYTGNDDFPF